MAQLYYAITIKKVKKNYIKKIKNYSTACIFFENISSSLKK
jgi:hypothetical protein